MVNLFEYQNKVSYLDESNKLEEFLDEVWKKRERNPYFANDTEEEKIESQRFLQFIHRSDEIKSNKYVGVIHFGGEKINLLPKIFYDPVREYNPNQITQIHNHILWWLSYCRKIKFPNYLSTLDSVKSDFFEVLIYLFAKFTRELLSNSIYQQYQEISRELSFIKGRLNINDYINENLSKGRWHKVQCTYDSFEMDNKFNRIIKYVADLLFKNTKSLDNKKNLLEILFILDEVTYESATAAQCAGIKFNPMFGEFETVRDYCHLFLSNCISYDYKNDLRLFAFLLPMEYVFEDFIFGFIEKEIPEIKAKSQRSDIYLDEDKNFNLRPDLYLEANEKSFIADTKYKIVYSDEKDPKKGISQTDLYQMSAYAIRFNSDKILLFYPNTVVDNQERFTELIIKDTLAGDKEINVKVFQLPVINKEILNLDIDRNKDLNELFEDSKRGLAERIGRVVREL